MNRALAKALNGGESAVYLLHGEEPFLTREAAEALRQTVMRGGLEDFNLDRFDARDKPDPERIAQAARTLPMMAARRLVWVKNADALAALGAKVLAPLTDYIAKPDPSTCLLLEAPSKVKGNLALFKACKSHGLVHESAPLRDRELLAFATERATLRGRVLRPDAAALLAEAIGRDLGAIDTALERLSLFVDGEAPIEVAHVEQVVPHTRTHTVWELVDAVAERRPALVLAHAQVLLDQGEAPLKLLSMVVRQFRQLLVGRSVRAAGGSADEAAAAAGVPPFRARTFASQVERYSGAELLRALERLAETDRSLKSSKLPGELLFQAALLDLCAG